MSDKAKPVNRCNCCGQTMQGNSELCIQCFTKLVLPCTACSYWNGRHWQVRRQKGRTHARVHCDICNNERYVLSDYIPFRESESAV